MVGWLTPILSERCSCCAHTSQLLGHQPTAQVLPSELYRESNCFCHRSALQLLEDRPDVSCHHHHSFLKIIQGFLQFLIINAAISQPSPSSSPSLGHTLMCDVLKAYGMSEAGHQSSGQSHFGATLVEVIIQQPTDYFFLALFT